MPAALDSCVESLLTKWDKDPSSRPTPKKDEEGKPQDAKSQATAICQSSQKKDEPKKETPPSTSKKEELEWNNPTITGMALTNRPHIKGLDPISWIQEGGKKLLKVPLLILGKWSHPTGVLNFSKETIDRMVANFKDRLVGHDISIDAKHLPEIGAVGWTERFDSEVRADGKTQFFAVAEATAAGAKIVDEKRYRYASLEFHTNWEHPLRAALSTDELAPFTEEAIMPNENVISLEAQLDEANKSQRDLQEALRLEEEKRSKLEERLVVLEKQNYRQSVDSILLKAEAYRDEKNRGHSKTILDWARDVFLEESIGEDDTAIELEDRMDTGQVRSYYRRAIARLLEILPGAVPMSAGVSDPDKKRFLSDDIDEESMADAVKQMWEA